MWPVRQQNGISATRQPSSASNRRRVLQMKSDALCDGGIEGTKQFLDVLPQALETSAETVKRALDQTVRELELAKKQEAETRDKIWRENFRPHAIILTEHT